MKILLLALVAAPILATGVDKKVRQRRQVVAAAPVGQQVGAGVRKNQHKDVDEKVGTVTPMEAVEEKAEYSSFYNRLLQDSSVTSQPTSSPTTELAVSPCNFEVVAEVLTWQEHQDTAEAQNCNLASILSQGEFDRVKGLIQGDSNVSLASSVYIGGKLRDAGMAGAPGSQNWEWSDGEAWEYENWLVGEPNDMNGVENRVTMRLAGERRQWNDRDGTLSFPAVYKCCSMDTSAPTQVEPLPAPPTRSPVVSTISPVVSPATPVPSDFVVVPTVEPTNCVFESNEAALSWDEHQAAAQNQNCNLASVLSQKDFDTVLDLIQGESSPPNVSESSFIYIGGKLRDDGTAGEPGAQNWEWVDNSAWNYENWLTGEPNNFDGTENRIAMRLAGGRRLWNDIDGTRSFPAVYKCCEGLTSSPAQMPASTAGPTLSPETPPTASTASPIVAPTTSPVTSDTTTSPVAAPTIAPVMTITESPVAAPTASPVISNTASPVTITMSPVVSPPSDTVAPVAPPSATPSIVPSSRPSKSPSTSPSEQPSLPPGGSPSNSSSEQPSGSPASDTSTAPSNSPSTVPSTYPSSFPSEVPSASPTMVPTASRSVDPSGAPSFVPSSTPSTRPSSVPSLSPSELLVATPTLSPTVYDGPCWFSVVEDFLTWAQHRNAAEADNCNLASLLSQEEHDEVVDLIVNSSSAVTSALRIYLGGQLREDGTAGERGSDNWEWIDGSEWSFENWFPDEPNNEFGNENLVVETVLTLLNLGGVRLWNDEDRIELAPAIYKCCRPEGPTPSPVPFQETCTATGWGDVHIETYDELKYDCHAEGEVVLARSLDSDFEIQGRFSKVGFPTVTTGMVLRERAGLPIVQISMATAPAAMLTVAGCPVKMYVDGQPRNLFDGTGSSSAIVRIEDNTVRVVYPSTGTSARMTVDSWQGVCHFSVDYTLPAGCLNDEQLVGILGSPNGDATDDWMTANGTVLSIPPGVGDFFFEPAYEYCVTNWCLRNSSESLFTYEDGMTFDDFENCDGAYDTTLEDQVDDAPQCFKDLCGSDIGCLVDAVTLGRGAAEAYLSNDAVDTSVCTPGPEKTCYFSCADALATRCDAATSGLYEICPDGEVSTAVWCDQETVDGGWMLLYAYEHEAGSNDALVSGIVPTDPNEGYSHFFVNGIQGYTVNDIESVRFYCTTSSHDRVVHFTSDSPVVKDIAFDGDQTANDPTAWRDQCFTSELSGHTAVIPAATDNLQAVEFSLYTTTGGFNNFPFYKGGNNGNHWGIRAPFEGTYRWECDDTQFGADDGISTDTLHNVWVKMKPGRDATSPSETCSFEIAASFLTWEEHEAAAEAEDCNMASLLTPAEHDSVVTLIENSSIPEVANAISVYLGGILRREDDGGQAGQRGAENWKWTDGSLWAYENWHASEPNNEFGAETVLTLFAVSGVRMWNDEDGTEQHPAVYKCCSSIATTTSP